MRITLALLVMIAVAAGCKPRPLTLSELPKGSPRYTQGWEDGCETGMQVYGNDFYKLSYDIKLDASLAENEEYMRAWRNAYHLCRWYTNTWTREWE